ncbi:MAG: hypothetical protein HZA34_00675 [Candidatus Pacebacteria bacterium]|nr:hypothetical protein [Candidatus Paceibacterota bacterium]
MAKKVTSTEPKEVKEKTAKVAKIEKVAKNAKKKTKKVEEVAIVETQGVPVNPQTGEQKEEKAKIIKIRGKKYVTARSFIDRTRQYGADEAVALAKKTHYAKFAGSLEANLVLRGEGVDVDIAFPYATGRTVSVAIATDGLLAQVEKGVITFTTLVAHPSMMPKLSKLARILGPKGLMPNPKNGTLSPDPEKRKKELENGAVTVKAEKKAPLVHLVIGKLKQPESELVANLKALMKAYPAGKLVKCTISATMGPGIKVRVE